MSTTSEVSRGQAGTAGDETLLSVRDLTVSYGGLTAVKNVSLDIAPGSVVGMIGPNGAGKTTFIDALMGYTPAQGRIEFLGQRIDQLSVHRRATLGLTRTFQSLELFEDLSVRENLQVSAEDPKWWTIFLDVIIPNRDVRAPRVDELLEAVGLKNYEGMLPAHLSHGDRQAVSIARAMVSDARVLLLDEPGAGLDRNEKEGLSQLLREAVADGTTIFLIDHDMDLVMPTCDHIFVLEFGELIASGTPDQIRSDPRVIEAYLGKSGDDTEVAATEQPAGELGGDNR